MIWIILFSLFLTTSIEGIVYAISNKFNLKTYIFLLIANLILNPTMNLIILSFKNENTYITALMIGEILTVAIESFIYYFITKKSYWYSLLIALTANVASFAIGNAINELNIITNEKAYLIGSIILLFVTNIELLTVILYQYYRHKNNRNDNSAK